MGLFNNFVRKKSVYILYFKKMSIFAGNFFGKEIETINKNLKGQNF